MFRHLHHVRRLQRARPHDTHRLRRGARGALLRLIEWELLLVMLGGRLVRPRRLRALLEPVALLMVGLSAMLLFLLHHWDGRSPYE